jgi:hypothetical protein
VDARHADAGIGFVDGAIGLDAQVGFQPPFAGA